MGGIMAVSLLAVSMFHNEEDICVPVVRHLLEQGVDHILVADNLSTDSTRAQLDELARLGPEFCVIDDPDPIYRQSQKMVALTHEAARRWQLRDHTWVIPFDADEFWFAQKHDNLKAAFEEADEAGLSSMTCDFWNFVPQLSDVGLPVYCEPDPLRRYKVAFKYHQGIWICDGNHTVNTPDPSRDGMLGVKHYPNRSKAQARYKCQHGNSILPDSWTVEMAGHWRWMAALDDEGFDDWWKGYTDPQRLVRY
jgi:hypothetical protein